MAWDTELPFELRFLINDLDANNYTYTDDQLKSFLVVSTRQVTAGLGPGWNSYIGGPYTINASGMTISPDPTDPTIPVGLANLILLKAACIIGRSEQKSSAAAGGWKIVDDKSVIDGTATVKGAKESADSFCQSYEDMLYQFEAGNINATMQAILTPFSSYDFPPGIACNNRWGGMRGI